MLVFTECPKEHHLLLLPCGARSSSLREAKVQKFRNNERNRMEQNKTNGLPHGQTVYTNNTARHNTNGTAKREHHLGGHYREDPSVISEDRRTSSRRTLSRGESEIRSFDILHSGDVETTFGETKPRHRFIRATQRGSATTAAGAETIYVLLIVGKPTRRPSKHITA